ncbi:hypothetical protein GOP47_0017562 [Adiantum capillus-veneris]|uniref:Uncharacterized protein n=1 Tax=Adiantum capillus-veneris TaxID=13818 RepID=A0A9D4UGL5_ADICA|nr:hypothetical protein GOP47_0017562 [Adiantum capillus-veneris]
MVWQTSNMEYGRFYSLTSEEEQRRLAGEREGRCEVLTKTLIQCQKQLGLMRLRDTSLDTEFSDGLDLPTESYFQAHLQKMKKTNRPSPEKVRTMTYSGAQPEEASSVLKSTSHSTMLPSSTEPSSRLMPSNPASSEEVLEEIRRPGNYAGRVDPTGIEEDTKQLEWILNRLADKLQPLTNGGLPVLKFTPTNPKPAPRLKERRMLRPKPNRMVQPKLPKCPPRSDQTPGGLRLPPYCRYGFYRYYGMYRKSPSHSFRFVS